MMASTQLLKRRRFDVDDVIRMGQAGLFEDERLELIDGELVEMTQQPGARHCGHVDLLNQRFAERCGQRCIVRVQNPLQLDDRHLLLPDLALLRPDADFYRSRYPGPADVLLVVEVADTTLARDRRAKLPIYARFQVPIVWIVDLRRQRIHVFESPAAGGYRVRRRCAGDDLLSIPGGSEVAAVTLFGGASPPAA